MLLFVAGLPGRFTEWCDALVVRLAEIELGRTMVLRADTLDQISRSLIGGGASRAVITSRQPSGRLRAALVEAGRRFIVAIDDPRIGLGQIVAGGGMELFAGIRAMAGACAAVERLASAPGALPLHAGSDGATPQATAAAIADHLELRVGGADITDAVNSLASEGIAPAADGAWAWWADLDPHAVSIATGALEPYAETPVDGMNRPIFWAPELFFLGDGEDRPAASPIDITGRPRCLLHGPEIIVAPGNWLLSLEMNFSPEATEHEFAIDILGCEPEERRVFRPAGDGRLAGNIDIVISETTERPLSIKLSSQRAAFDGTVALVGATLQRRSAAEASQ